MMLHVYFINCVLLITTVLANVEKTIFVAPPVHPVPQDASIDNLLLLSFNPQYPNARTHLNASFPSDKSTKGTESWALLEGLNPGQRYELRICWMATQPTAFWIYTHTLDETFSDPTLISSLSSFAHARHASLTSNDIAEAESRQTKVKASSHEASMLFLQIFAAAEYFSTNKTLMENVPPVYVDIILDPYLLNIFPQSLVPTAAYIAIIAVIAWFLSGWVFTKLSEISKADPNQVSADKRKKAQ